MTKYANQQVVTPLLSWLNITFTRSKTENFLLHICGKYDSAYHVPLLRKKTPKYVEQARNAPFIVNVCNINRSEMVSVQKI